MSVPALGRMYSSASTAIQRRRPLPQAAPTTRRSQRVFRAKDIIADDPNLLASIRELYSRRPETRFREAWELQHILNLLGYTDGLAEEVVIVAALEVART